MLRLLALVPLLAFASIGCRGEVEVDPDNPNGEAEADTENGVDVDLEGNE